MTTRHKLSPSEALDLVENDATKWVEIPDEGDAESIRRQVRALDEAAAQLDNAVIRARRRGLTWMQISQALGVSHQAAHKKYADRIQELSDNP